MKIGTVTSNTKFDFGLVLFSGILLGATAAGYACCLLFKYKIPDAVLGIVIGSVLTWFGVFAQLRHNAKGRQKEYQLALRKEVYLNAARHIGELIDCMYNYFQADKVVCGTEYTQAVNQICMVGDTEAIRTVMTLNDLAIEAVHEMAPDKFKLDQLFSEVKKNQEEYNVVLKRIGHRNDECPKQDPQATIQLQEQNQVDFDYLDSREDSHLQLYKSYVKLLYELAERSLQYTKHAFGLQTSFFLAVRKDLNMVSNEVAFREIHQLSDENWKANVEAYYASMKTSTDKIAKDIAHLRHQEASGSGE